VAALYVWSSESAHAVGHVDFSTKYLIWAIILGGLSAASLPLGSALGVVWQPKPVITGAFAAFGAGALLAALSVELVAPTMMGISHGGAAVSHDESLAKPIALIIGGVCGGILFVLLDQLINAKGGYLRKTATTITYLSKRKNERIKRLLARLGESDFFRSIPPEHIHHLVDYIRPVRFEENDVIFNEGDPGNKMYFIDQGEIQLQRGGDELTVLKAGDVLGEIAVITGAARTAKAIAKTVVKVLVLTKQDFQHVRKVSPAFEEAALKLASERLEKLSDHSQKKAQTDSEWAINAANAVRQGNQVLTTGELRREAHEHGSPLAIWLGIFLDGIPESFVIGSGFLAILTAKLATSIPSFTEIIPYTLIAGLFLSNFPEAMSSSIGMKKQGWKSPKIFMMWLSLMIMTAVGAGIGYAVGADVNPVIVSGLQGLAAGAMLTMIAQTMIPEAVHLGGPTIVGLSTLSGFLGAVSFKLLEM